MSDRSATKGDLAKLHQKTTQNLLDCVTSPPRGRVRAADITNSLRLLKYERVTARDPETKALVRRLHRAVFERLIAEMENPEARVKPALMDATRSLLKHEEAEGGPITEESDTKPLSVPFPVA